MSKHLPLIVVISIALGGCGKSEEQKKKDVQEEAAKAFVEAFAKLAEATSHAETAEDDEFAKRTVKLGETIRLGSLELTPVSVELKKVGIKSFLGGEPTQIGPVLVLAIRAKNVSEGQVFHPFMMAEGRDNFGNKLDEGVNSIHRAMIDGDDSTNDIAPGKTGTVLLIKAVKFPKATSYQWDVTSTVDNKETLEHWRCTTTVSEIKAADTPE